MMQNGQVIVCAFCGKSVVVEKGSEFWDGWWFIEYGAYGHADMDADPNWSFCSFDHMRNWLLDDTDDSKIDLLPLNK